MVKRSTSSISWLLLLLLVNHVRYSSTVVTPLCRRSVSQSNRSRHFQGYPITAFFHATNYLPVRSDANLVIEETHSESLGMVSAICHFCNLTLQFLNLHDVTTRNNDSRSVVICYSLTRPSQRDLLVFQWYNLSVSRAVVRVAICPSWLASRLLLPQTTHITSQWTESSYKLQQLLDAHRSSSTLSGLATLLYRVGQKVSPKQFAFIMLITLHDCVRKNTGILYVDLYLRTTTCYTVICTGF